jgi:hypothetical protein
MYAAVIHTVKDRKGWDEVLRSFDPASIAEGFELLATGTSEDTARTICLWRAPSVEALQKMLDEGYGELAVNDCFGVPDHYAYVAGQQQTASV